MARQTTTSDLPGLLEAIGLDQVRQKGDEVWACCPDHADSNPSWSMNTETGAHSCFSCGYRGSLLYLLCDKLDLSVFAAKRIMRDYGVADLEMPERAEEPAKPKLLPEQKLKGFEMPPATAMEKRGLDRLSVIRYGVRWRPDTKAWIFPIRTPSGKLLGWQEKSKEAVRNRPMNMEKSLTVFGAEHLRPCERAVLVESPLDVVYLHGLGYEDCFASFGANVSDEQMRLLDEYAESIVVALDHDEAGEKCSWRLREEFGKSKTRLLFLHYDVQTEAKDPGEMDAEEAVWSVENAIPYLDWRPSIWSPTDHKPRKIRRVPRNAVPIPRGSRSSNGGAKEAPGRLRDGPGQDGDHHRSHRKAYRPW